MKKIIILLVLFILVFLLGKKEKIVKTLSGGEKKLPIYCVDRDEKVVSISFDAAWGNEDTGRILDILKENDVKATFFMTGSWVDSYPDDVKRIYEEGHDLGNHSLNHKQMSKLGSKECVKEIMDVHDKVKSLTGFDMILFRPPYGDYNNNLIETSKECGYYTIQWDVDSLDWKDYGVDSIINTVTKSAHLGNGSIILCHNGAKYTAEALDKLIKNIKDMGYEFVPVSEMIYKEECNINFEGRQMRNN